MAVSVCEHVHAQGQDRKKTAPSVDETHEMRLKARSKARSDTLSSENYSETTQNNFLSSTPHE